jgi:hypothetical protein
MALAPLLPILVAIGHDIMHPLDRGPPGGDFAVLEIHLRSVARLEHLLGPYSQFGWSHPGPCYYFALLPLYWLSGGTSQSLYVSAGLITLLAAGASVAMFFRERPAPRDRALFMVAFCGFALDLFASRLPDNPWNPVVTVVPFALLWVLCARVAASGIALLPAAVMLHAFLVQTHISYLPCATALVGTAMVLSVLLRPRGQAPPMRYEMRRALLLSLLGAGVLWLPSVLHELGPDKSNVGAILRYFLGEKAQPNPVGASLTYGAARMHAPMLRLLDLSNGAEAIVAPVMGGLQVALMVVGAWWARIRRERFALASCALGLVATLVCFWSCRHLGTVSTKINYLTLWFAVVGMLNWLAIGIALLPTSSGVAETRKGVLVMGCAAALVGALTLADIRAIFGRYRRASAGPAWQVLPMASERVHSLLGHAQVDYVLGVGDGRPWDVLAGVALELDKRGLTPIFDARWRFMFGNGQRYARRDKRSRALIFSTQLAHAARLSDSFSATSFLYVEAPSTSQLARVTVTAFGAVGDPMWVVDGRSPPPGVPWDAPCMLALTTEASFVSLRLPGLRVEALDAVVDGNDGYVVDASIDGEAFTRVAEVPPGEAPGSTRRHITLGQGGPWRELRLSPRGGDGHYAVGEVQLDTRAWGLVPLGASGVQGDVRSVVDGNRPREGKPWSTRGGVRLTSIGSTLTFELPDMVAQNARVEGVRVSADGNDAYEVSGSYDGQRFVPIGILPQARGRGTRTRDFFFNDGRDWSEVRISPIKGEGRFSISEMSPIVTAGLLVDLASGRAAEPYLGDGWVRAAAHPDSATSMTPHARLRLPMHPGLDYRLGMLLGRGESGGLGRVKFRLNGQAMTELTIGPGTLAYTLDLPGSAVQAENELDLDISSDASGSVPAAILLRSLWLSPAPTFRASEASVEAATPCP